MTVTIMIEEHRPRLPCTLAPSQAIAWQQLTRDQHGLLDTDQLQLLGIGPGVVAANLKAHRWRRVLPRVYATFTGPLIREARIIGALLYGGPRAVLSHTTAAEEWRMLAIDPLSPVHITVPYGCSAVSHLPHVVVHRSRAFPYLLVATDPPRTSKADTVLDLATIEPDGRGAMRRFVALATKGRVPYERCSGGLRNGDRAGTARLSLMRSAYWLTGCSRPWSSATPATSNRRTRSRPRNASSPSSLTAELSGRSPRYCAAQAGTDRSGSAAVAVPREWRYK